MEDLLRIAKQHLADIEAGVSKDKFALYFAENVLQTEYPNALNPKGGSSDFNTLMERSEKGKQIITSQSFEVKKEYLSGQTVILEVRWTGYFTIPIGNTKPGEPIKAFFALFIEFEDGKIVRQRNYDCFEPF